MEANANPGSANPAIAVDAANDLHVVYHGSNEIWYKKRTGTPWGSAANVSNNSSELIIACITVNGSGQIMVASEKAFGQGDLTGHRA